MRRRSTVFDATFFLLTGGAAALVSIAWMQGGSELVSRGASGGGALLLRYGAVIVVSFLLAGFVEVLLPHDLVQKHLGEESGMRGIAIASVAGMLTPAGPFVSLPIAAVMLRVGAGPGPVVAFLTAWSLLAVHRFIAWEVPILGLSFAAARYAVCLVLPLVAGVLARIFLR